MFTLVDKRVTNSKLGGRKNYGIEMEIFSPYWDISVFFSLSLTHCSHCMQSIWSSAEELVIAETVCLCVKILENPSLLLYVQSTCLHSKQHSSINIRQSDKLLKHQVMFQILFLNLILLWRPSHGAPSHGMEVDVSVMTPCPYPLPEMIQPCQCFADQSYKGLVLKHFTVFLLTEIST